MPVVVRGCGVALLSLLIVGLVPVVEASAQCDGVLGGQSAVQACASGSSVDVIAGTSAPGSSSGSSGGVAPASSVPVPEGAVVVGGVVVCVPNPGEACLTPIPVAPGAGGVDVAASARSAAASLGVPAPVIGLSPEPSGNRWGALGVGLPIWAWVDDPGSLSASASQDGIDISLSASRGSVTFDWGDGTSSTCTQMVQRPVGVDPLMQSPVCGHAYLKAGDYTITATSSWDVLWQALGQQGRVELSSSATYQMPIREFVTVVIG